MKILKFKGVYISTSALTNVIYTNTFGSNLIQDVMKCTSAETLPDTSKIIYAMYSANSRNTKMNYEEFMGLFSMDDFMSQEAFDVLKEILGSSKPTNPMPSDPKKKAMTNK